MARTFRDRMREERGFTLLELLATVLIIGILAAIAVTQYLGHKDRADDAEAKSYARNLVTQVEACFASEKDYRDCDSQTKLDNAAGVPYGTDPGEASVVNATETSYEVEGVSNSSLGGTRHVFSIEKDVATGVITTSCSPAGQGGCSDSGDW